MKKRQQLRVSCQLQFMPACCPSVHSPNSRCMLTVDSPAHQQKHGSAASSAICCRTHPGDFAAACTASPMSPKARKVKLCSGCGSTPERRLRSVLLPATWYSYSELGTCGSGDSTVGLSCRVLLQDDCLAKFSAQCFRVKERTVSKVRAIQWINAMRAAAFLQTKSAVACHDLHVVDFPSALPAHQVCHFGPVQIQHELVGGCRLGAHVPLLQQ